MKILVFSDSHGDMRNISAALSIHHDAECVFFLGDGLSDLEAVRARYKNIFFVSVRGNCDFVSYGASDEELITLEGTCFLLMHGHHFGVKYSLTRAIEYAKTRGADVLMYGHTHIPDNRYIPDDAYPIYVFNPGSISRPRDGRHTYGVIDIVSAGISLSHGKL